MEILEALQIINDRDKELIWIRDRWHFGHTAGKVITAWHLYMHSKTDASCLELVARLKDFLTLYPTPYCKCTKEPIGKQMYGY
jgi:hypothetical protein